MWECAKAVQHHLGCSMLSWMVHSMRREIYFCGVTAVCQPEPLGNKTEATHGYGIKKKMMFFCQMNQRRIWWAALMMGGRGRCRKQTRLKARFCFLEETGDHWATSSRRFKNFWTIFRYQRLMISKGGCGTNKGDSKVMRGRGRVTGGASRTGRLLNVLMWWKRHDGVPLPNSDSWTRTLSVPEAARLG